ncbi:unnamed protein product [Caenorhabditis brenneri]
MGHAFHPPQFTQLFNILLTIGVAIAFSLAGIFDYSALNHTNVLLEVFSSTALLASFIGVSKCFTIVYDQNNGTGLRTKCRRDYLIGCGGIILVHFIQFFVISFPGIDYEIRFSAFFTFNITSLILYFTFIWKVERLYKVAYTWKPALIISILYVSSYLITRYFFHQYFMKSRAIDLVHFVYLIFVTIETATFVEVLKGQIQRIFRLNDEEDWELRTIIVENPEDGSIRIEDSNGMNSESQGSVRTAISWVTFDETADRGYPNLQLDSIECDKCLMKFDEKMARTLLKHNNSHYFICPFCEQVTSIYGALVDRQLEV